MLRNGGKPPNSHAHNTPNVNPTDQYPNKSPKQAKNTQLQSNHLCSFYNVYSHYTHHCPHLDKEHQWWNELNKREAMTSPLCKSIPPMSQTTQTQVAVL